LCKEAGAADIACIGWLSDRHWRSTGLKKVIDEEGAKLDITNLHDESLFKKMDVPGGVKLNSANIMESLFKYDILINMNITKEHSGNKFSGALKNMMGLNSPVSNQTFHRRSWKLFTEDIDHLETCIADLNTVVKADLCLVDATEFVITNGPMGPGKLKKENKVIASTDPVAADAYCARFFNLQPAEVKAIRVAHDHGLGEMDLQKLKIKEVIV
jgi:uncharacterized protein (DUF362 family)